MSETRTYRIVFNKGGELLTRKVALQSAQAVADLRNWLDDEYDYAASLKKAYWLRNDGVEEQIY